MVVSLAWRRRCGSFKKCPLICLPGDTGCAHLPTHTNEPSVHLQILLTGSFVPHARLLSCCRAKLKTALNWQQPGRP